MYQVMLVDDEPNILDNLTNYVQLANLGFHVSAKALGAEDALFSLGITKPDLVITDIKMPVTDGLTLLQKMRQTAWNGYAAIITGYDDFAYAQQAIRLNVFEYLLKPVFPDDIAALLKRTKDLFDRDRTNLAKLRREIETEFQTESPPDNEDGRIPSYIGQAKAYIKENYTEQLTLSQVAKVVSVSPVYLSSSFQKHCGKNFLEYVTHYRMVKAKELLDQSNLQIQEIAIRVGYLDIAYFSRVFRRETGLTPSNYRSKKQ
jgi:two-component system response regulator YesN